MEEVISIASLERTAKSLEKRVTHQRITRVPSRLYHTNPEAYTPKFVSIGPFHHIGRSSNQAKDVNFLAMEGQKRIFMLRLLERTISKEDTFQSCWDFLREETPTRIRSYYSEELDTNLDDQLLAKIMLVDGCFLLEVLMWSYEGSKFPMLEDDGGTTSSSFMTPMILGLRRDLALLENQLPFFVLQELYATISPFLKRNQQEETPLPDLTQMAVHFFRLPPNGPQHTNHLHLLDLILQCHLPSAKRLEFLTNHCYHHYNRSHLDTKDSNKLPLSRGVILRTATKLRDAGVTFYRATKTSAILDLRFKHGVLEIPPLVLNDCIESLLRNLLVFEHVSKNGNENFVSYVIFMDHLIGSKEDLQVLESRGIIVNELGGREDAINIFHRISKQFVLKNFYFRDLCQEIENFCESPRQRYIQELKQRYLNSPWAALSLVAATILLILTMIQTVYTVLSYYHQSY